MCYRIGDVTREGNIVLSPTAYLQVGEARLSLAQALKARQFGWKLIPGTVQAIDSPDYVVVNVRRMRVPSNYV